VELAVLAPGVTEAGANKHCSSAGRSEHERATAELTAPPTGITETLALPVWPEGISIAVGVAPRLNVGGGGGGVATTQVVEKFTAFDIWFFRLGLPTAST
jgi:hypothetical protein